MTENKCGGIKSGQNRASAVAISERCAVERITHIGGTRAARHEGKNDGHRLVMMGDFRNSSEGLRYQRLEDRSREWIRSVVLITSHQSASTANKHTVSSSEPVNSKRSDFNPHQRKSMATQTTTGCLKPSYPFRTLGSSSEALLSDERKNI